ncbi:hypothetical protein MMC06_003998 [Schaereria dolodes]|nr:hypothetical protein [Schaereria dolodes]
MASPVRQRSKPNVAIRSSHLIARPQDTSDIVDEQPAFLQHTDDIKHDMRSSSIPYKRNAAEGYKYWRFKGVKWGDLGQKYITAADNPTKSLYGTNCAYPPWFFSIPANPKERKVATWTKQDVYKQAQRYPRPPKRHHSSRDAKGGCGWLRRQARAQEAEGVARTTLPEVMLEMGCLTPHCTMCKLERDYEDRIHEEDRQLSFWAHNGSGIPLDKALLLDHREKEYFSYSVERALMKWNDQHQKADDRFLEETWETISETLDFDFFSNCSDNEDDEWVEVF